MDEVNEKSVELRDVPLVEVREASVHGEVIVEDYVNASELVDSFSIDNFKVPNPPLTTGYLNDFFHQQNDVFEKNNYADLLNSPDVGQQTSRDMLDASIEERLMIEEFQ